jgi:hypothetical protein
MSPRGPASRRGEGARGLLLHSSVRRSASPTGCVGAARRSSRATRTRWFTPKLQLIARKNVQVAAGDSHHRYRRPQCWYRYGARRSDRITRQPRSGLARRTAAVIGLRSAIGGEHRTSRRISGITENWLWRGSARGFVSGGVRMGAFLLPTSRWSSRWSRGPLPFQLSALPGSSNEGTTTRTGALEGGSLRERLERGRQP